MNFFKEFRSEIRVILILGIGILTIVVVWAALNSRWFTGLIYRQVIYPNKMEIPLSAPDYLDVTVSDLKQNPAGYHNKKITVEGIYRWGFEDSNFDETAASEEYHIWVEATEKTQLENTPPTYLNYRSGDVKILNPSAKVTIYGTFHAYDMNSSSREWPPERGEFGHLGLWKHEIVADKIIFTKSVETTLFEQKVLALTDKLTYQLGEKVSVVIRSKEDKDIWLAPLCGVPFVLQKHTNNVWEDYHPYPTKGCYSPPQNIKAGAEKNYQLNLSEIYQYPDFHVEPGQYRFSFRYSFANLNLVGQRVQLFDALSNEFTIGAQRATQEDRTSTWQTYRNDEFGFEIQRPPQGFGIKVIRDETSLETYLQKFNESRTAKHPEFDPIVILERKDVQVGPYEAIQYETAQYAVPSVSIETYFQIDNSAIIRIVTSRIDESDVTEDMRQLHNQILSTFRFVR